MTSAEIDTAMRNRCPVEYGGTRYCRIVEHVSWYDYRGTRQLCRGKKLLPELEAALIAQGGAEPTT